MIEIPESKTIAAQAERILSGRTIVGVFNATHSHKFAWYSGDPLKYSELLTGRTICSARGSGSFVDLRLDGDAHLIIGDGTNLRHYLPDSDVPSKYQLLLTLDDECFLVFTVAMYGAIYACKGDLDNPYFTGAVSKLSPLDDRFDAHYFESLLSGAKKTLSVKAFLATEQRIPGLGNGVLQDLLFRAGLHPKRRLATLGGRELEMLFGEIKTTLSEMTLKGGRDTERDLFGAPGGYETLLSQKTYGQPCPVCGVEIVKEAYLGGAVYYCPCCQR